MGLFYCLFLVMKYFKLICIEGEIIIIADDAVEAGYIGLEISNQMNYTLVDVIPVKMNKKITTQTNGKQLVTST